MIRRIPRSIFTLAVLTLAGCNGSAPPTSQEKRMHLQDLSPAQRQALASRKVYFGHQSVGRNIVAGLKELNQENGLGLNIVSSKEPATIGGPAFIESNIGRNGAPFSKTDEFAANIAGMGEGSVALHKYCYLDIGPETDPNKLFDEYRSRMRALKEQHSGLVIVHATMPLTADENWAKMAVKRVLGKTTSRDLNAKRNRFNQLLLEAFAQDPIFDLARIESTRADGSRVAFEQSGQPVYTLAPEYTDDGEHLNAKGRRVAAEQLLLTLAQVPAAQTPPAATPAAPRSTSGR